MEPKHSGMGIASFAISIVVGVIVFLLIAVAAMATASTPGGMDDNSPTAMVIGLGIVLMFGLDVVAIGLGIAGIVQKNRKKVFAILGVVFGAATILGTIVLAIIGSMMP